MKKSTKWLLATTLLASGISSTAHSSPGVYFGVGLGHSDLNETNFDDDTSKRLFAGYQVNRFFSLEAGYNNLGHFNSSSISASSELDGFEASVIASYPIRSQLSVFGRVGIWKWDYDAKTANGTVSRSENGSDLFYGAGLDVKINNRLKVRAAYDEYEVNNATPHVASLNILYTF